MNIRKIIEEKVLKNKLISLIILLLIVFIKLLNQRGIYIFVGAIDQNTILGGLCIILLFLAFFWIRTSFVFYVLLSLSITVTAAFTIGNYNRAKKNIVIAHSPNKEYSILIQDGKFTRFYYKEYGILYRRLKVDWAATSYHAFRDGNYSITWTSDHVIEIMSLLFDESFYFYTVLDLKHTDQLFKGEMLQIKNGTVKVS